ncbi:ionotropic receptor 75a-like [Anthonomus grandis grandis]|uniref:ionotropic receptor 75a-like n=1 Tax=Anthonomus grandis grandis TaxID=2921223 RepID=UPI0021652807|nr:ionotropic receptor 75a-like [Anthonomus grandis grandis]
MNFRAILLGLLLTKNLNGLLLHFLNYFNGKNSFVTAFGCDKKELVYLSKVLSSRGILHKCFTRSENFLEGHIIFPNHWFVIDLNCADSLQILHQANKSKLFAFPYQWLLSYDAGVIQPKIAFLNLSILINSDFTLSRREKNGSFTFKKIYKKTPNQRHFEVEDIGSWTPETGFQKSQRKDLGLFENRQNMGIVIRACMVVTNNDTLRHLTDKRNKHIDSISKVSYVLILTMAPIFNVTLNMSICNTWGYKDNASNWNGMMGKILRNEADIAGTVLFFKKEKIPIIDYVASLSPTVSKFVFRQPKLSYVTNVYTLPFDNKVWICSIFLVIIMMGSLYGFTMWENLKAAKEAGTVENNIDVFIVTFGAICQQGAPFLPNRIPGRIATLVLLISLTFLYVAFSANIVSLFQTPSKSIQTLEDLLNSRLSLGVEDRAFNRHYFKVADDRVRKSLYQKKVAPQGKPPNFMFIEDGVRRMRQGLFAFHMEIGSGYKLVSETFKEDEKCDLQEIEFLQVVHPWLPIQKHSSYKEKFKVGFRLLAEAGIQQRENILIYSGRPTCNSKSSSFYSVGIVDCSPALAIAAGGFISSFCIFLGELYFYYVFKKNKK